MTGVTFVLKYEPARFFDATCPPSLPRPSTTMAPNFAFIVGKGLRLIENTGFSAKTKFPALATVPHHRFKAIFSPVVTRSPWLALDSIKGYPGGKGGQKKRFSFKGKKAVDWHCARRSWQGWHPGCRAYRGCPVIFLVAVLEGWERTNPGTPGDESDPDPQALPPVNTCRLTDL